MGIIWYLPWSGQNETKSINSQGKDLLSLFVKFENRIAVITSIIKNKTQILITKLIYVITKFLKI